MPSAKAAKFPENASILTDNLLRERVRLPEIKEGKHLINLRNLTIDLRSKNYEFRTQFYQQLKSYLNQPVTPVVLDISNSVILGYFAGNELGLRVPLYAESLSPMFTEEELSQIKRDRRRLSQLTQSQRLRGVNINTATSQQLKGLGFSPSQAIAIRESRQEQLFRNLNELLSLDEIDLATYVKVSEKAFCSQRSGIFAPVLDIWQWLGLSLLLLLSAYGTSSWLVFGVGMVALSYFGVLFWAVDRCRRRVPKPILPNLGETISVAIGFTCLTGVGLVAIFNTPENPWLTLGCLAIFLLPLPIALLSILYGRGRYHKLLDVSYFVEDGGMRQMRLTIGRLPIVPRFPLFRDRYAPILWTRRWNWLNYYDFSLNNLFKFGFNDIRVRDQHLPGLISTIVWYQWSLGILYLTLLLWTLSRTIPGFNLLIYLK